MEGLILSIFSNVSEKKEFRKLEKSAKGETKPLKEISSTIKVKEKSVISSSSKIRASFNAIAGKAQSVVSHYQGAKSEIGAMHSLILHVKKLSSIAARGNLSDQEVFDLELQIASIVSSIDSLATSLEKSHNNFFEKNRKTILKLSKDSDISNTKLDIGSISVISETLKFADKDNVDENLNDIFPSLISTRTVMVEKDDSAKLLSNMSSDNKEKEEDLSIVENKKLTIYKVDESGLGVKTFFDKEGNFVIVTNGEWMKVFKANGKKADIDISGNKSEIYVTNGSEINIVSELSMESQKEDLQNKDLYSEDSLIFEIEEFLDPDKIDQMISKITSEETKASFLIDQLRKGALEIDISKENSSSASSKISNLQIAKSQTGLLKEISLDGQILNENPQSTNVILDLLSNSKLQP